MTMQAVFFPGDKKVEVRQVEIPTPGQGEVLIQLKASAICRSDMSLYYGTSVLEEQRLVVLFLAMSLLE